jgi:hypothetical protein
VAILDDVLDRYAELLAAGLLPRGPRGCFYDLRPRGRERGVSYFKRKKDPRTGKLPLLGPMDADVGTVQEIVTHARRAGILPESWVDDERAPDPIVPLGFADAEEASAWVERIVDGLPLERQSGQDVFVEVWCEAAGITGRLAAVADPYGVPVYPGGGFDGIKGKRDAAKRAASRDVPTVALHVGDYDKHGRWIFKAVAEDVACWVPSYVPEDTHWNGPWQYVSGPERVTLRSGETLVLDVRRLAVTDAQVDAGDVDLDDDGKAEAEQLPVEWQILTDALDALLDPTRREVVLQREPSERERLRELLAQRWS